VQRLREEEEAKRRVRENERNWLASIPKGVEGVKMMLERLRKACEGNKKELDVALDALYTLFSQIASNPENVQFRRVRRDHPRFLEDIGRHDGGKEVLIAAGFVFAEVDGVDCFFSKEPDLEHDMDAWSQWFDVIRGTVSAIEEEMIKG
jgi:PUB domain.